MKFSAERGVLAEAVTNAAKACAPKSIASALDGVLLSLRGEKLTITGYDLEMGVRTTIFVNGKEDGDIIADARIFGEFVRKMPSDSPIDIEVRGEKEISIKSGKNIREKMNGVSANNFPRIISLADNIFFKMKEPLLKDMLSQVYHAVAQDSENPTLCGVKFSIDENVLSVVASDAMRMAIRKEFLNYAEIEFILPEKAALELMRNLSDDSGEEEKFVDITIDRNQCSFAKDNYILFSRLIDGKFIDFNRVTEFVPTREVIVATKDLSSALERAMVSITERLKSPVTLALTGKGKKAEMCVSCKTNIAVTEEIIPVELITAPPQEFDSNGDEIPFKVNFNPRFLLDALKNSGVDAVKLQFLLDIKPFKIVAAEHGSFTFLVVPMRV